jgi:hypothetical protein
VLGQDATLPPDSVAILRLDRHAASPESADAGCSFPEPA